MKFEIPKLSKDEVDYFCEIVLKGEEFPKAFERQIHGLIGKSLATATTLIQMEINNPTVEIAQLLNAIELMFDDIQKGEKLKSTKTININ